MAVLNDTDIVSALKENAKNGFRLLMAKYKEAVYWHIRRLVVLHDDAQDATQETFVRVFRSFLQFKGECSLGTWIYRIATNEALRILERRREEQLSLEAPEAGANTLMADDYVDYGDLEAVKLQKATQPNERRRNGAGIKRTFRPQPEDIGLEAEALCHL